MCVERQPPSAAGRHFLSLSLLLALLVGLAALLLTSTSAHAAEQPTLDQAELPATGKQETLVHAPGFGRYALLATSRQGTAVQVVDRMAGPGEIAGQPGQHDGRLDLFLDRGTYKLVTRAHEEGSGQVGIEAHAFDELNLGLAPRIVDNKLVETELADFQQRSWWIEIDGSQADRVVLEAAGRHLADLRLWRDGSWLVEDMPSIDVIEPVEGRPMLRCQLSAVLEPGLYLLTAYGGPSQPWSEGGAETPLLLRSGVPSLGESGRMRAELSPFGEDRYRVPAATDLFRLELPEALPAKISVVRYREHQPFATGGRTGHIQEESVPPVTTVTTGGGGEQLVTIQGAAGQAYVFQHFPIARPVEPIISRRPVWLSTLHAGAVEDSLEPTSILVRRPKTGGRTEIVKAEVVDLKGGKAFHRRFNLLEPATLFVHLDEPGSWAVKLDDPLARIRVEPFMITPPRGYEPPSEQQGSSRWELDAGYHVVSITPHRMGVAELTIKPHGLLDSVLGVVGLERERELMANRAGARFSSLSFSPDYDYELYSNQVPGVRMGLVHRELPLDMVHPLPVALAPDETVSIETEIPERGSLRLVDDKGSLLDISVDGKAWMQQPDVRAGVREVRVRNQGPGAVVATLWHEPDRLRSKTPLERITMDALAAIPEFPRITEAEPGFFDLDRGARTTFRLEVDEPALYVLESTGLLATNGKVRTRTVLSLAQAAQNGVGRNFLVQSYLGSGEYQVTVQAQGRSKGHAGLRLRRTELTEGGELKHGVAARAHVPAGDGIVYRFSVAEDGLYALNALGEQRGFRCRLEDADGWPVERPGASLPDTRWLEAGDYRMVLLPEAVDTRRVTSVAPVEQDLHFEGHGPHALPLARTVAHTWREPQDGSERTPDRWQFALPAPVDVDITLSEDMAGELFLLDGDNTGERAARVSPGQSWRGALAAGDYELQARAARRDHGLHYSVHVQPTQLVVGTRTQLSAPSVTEIAVGHRGLVELASHGDRDVRARLTDSQERLVAASDDRPEDWNFQLVERLEPGRYTLRLDPVGDDYASTTVTMTAPAERTVKALTAGGERALEPGDEVLLVPLEGLGRAELLALRARSEESVGMALEARRAGIWQPVAEDAGRQAMLVARLGEAEAWRVRVWSLDRRGNPVRLAASLPRARGASEARMARATELGAGRQALPAAVAVKTNLDRPGLLAVSGDPVLWCPHAGKACIPVENGLVAPMEAELWLVAAITEPGASARVQVERVQLASGAEPTAPVHLGLGDVVMADLEGGLPGPVLVEASAVTGQPGVRVVDWFEQLQTPSPSEGMDVGDRAAVAVSLDARDPALLAWNADPEALTGTELRTRQWRFAAPLPEAAPPGSIDLPVPSSAARAWALPDQPVLLRVAISTGMVAVLEGDGGVEACFWAQRAPREIELRTDARRLVVLNASSEEGRAALDVIPGVEPEPALVMGQPWERRLVRAGSLRLDLPPAEHGETLHVRGAVERAVLVDAEGRVHAGLDLAVPTMGGTVELRHAPGLVLAWIDRPGSEGEGLWGQVVSPWTVDLTTPSILALEGPSALLRFEPTKPAALHLRSAQALVVGTRHGDGSLRVEAHEVADGVDLLLPGGPTSLQLRPLGTDQLHGSLELSSTPILDLDEGLGPKMLMAPGDTRWFRFEVERAGPVGLGVQADADRLDLVLYDETGREQGRGLAQMPSLEPGSWLLALRLPPGTAPVHVRPVVVGIDLPDTGPPDDVVRRFAKLAGATPADVQED